MRVGDTDNSDCDVRVALPVAEDDNPWSAARRPVEALSRRTTEPTIEKDMPWISTSRRNRTCCARWCAGVCQRYCDLKVVREMEDDPRGFPDKLWTQLADLGLIGLTLPEEYGGTGMSMLDARDRLHGVRARARRRRPTS